MKKNNHLKGKPLSYKIAYYVIIAIVSITLLFSWIGGIHALRSVFTERTTTAYADEEISKTVIDIYAPLPTFYSLISMSEFIPYNEELKFTVDLTNNTVSAYVVSTETLNQPVLENGNIKPNTSATFEQIFSVMGATLSVSKYNDDYNYQFYLRALNVLPLNPIPNLLTVTSVRALRERSSVTYSINCVDVNGNDYPLNLSISTNPPLSLSTLDYSSTFYHNKNLFDGSGNSVDVEGIKKNSYDEGYKAGKAVADQAVKQEGYNQGLAESEYNRGYTFYTLMDSVFYSFYNFIYNLLNFDFFGYNMFGVFTFVASAGLLAFVLRFIL